jgi:hypothetical protein
MADAAVSQRELLPVAGGDIMPTDLHFDGDTIQAGTEHGAAWIERTFANDRCIFRLRGLVSVDRDTTEDTGLIMQAAKDGMEVCVNEDALQLIDWDLIRKATQP